MSIVDLSGSVALSPAPTPAPVPDGAGPLTVFGVGGRINLDYAATAPCARAAFDAVTELLPWYSSVHRGAGVLSRRCTLAYERARQQVADFLDCRPGDHVVFTRNTTDALNLLASVVPDPGTVVVFDGEHHANLLPWRRVVRLPAPSHPVEAVATLDAALAARRGADRAVLVSVTAASNVTGEIWPVAELTAVAHRHGARLAVDAAQLAPHAPVSLAEWDADYVAISGHKLYAPFGAGALAGRGDWLDAAGPYLAGGGATEHVGEPSDVRWVTGPARHEAGTPNLLGAVALGAVCTALAEADRDALHRREQALLHRLQRGLDAVPGVTQLRLFAADHPRVGIVSFALAGHDSAKVAARLAEEHGIDVRDGLFCAHPLGRRLLAEGAERAGRPLPTTAVRASFGLGSTEAHIDALVASVARIAVDG